MKMFFVTILAAAVVCSGCGLFRKGDSPSSHPPALTAQAQPATPSNSPPTNAPKLIVTPGSGVAGKVAVYNDAGRFVVLDFPIGQVPPAEQRMFVYRNGLKVGEVRITGPARDNHTVADIVAGEAQRGDDIRDK
jgi:hypothetical protein